MPLVTRRQSWGSLLVAAAVLVGSATVSSAVALGATSAGEDWSLEDVRVLIRAGQYGEAEQAARAFLAALTAQGRGFSLAGAEAAELITDALIRSGMSRGSDARQLVESAVAARTTLQGAGHSGVGGSLALLATVLRLEGDLVSARAVAERSLTLREGALGRDHPASAESLNALAGVIYDSGEFSTAAAMYATVAEVRERTLGPAHPDTGDALHNLARALRRRGDTDGAQKALQRALGILETAFGMDHVKVAGALNDIASLRKASGDFAGARPDLERALGIYERSLGPEHPFVAGVLNNLADLNMRMGDLAAARRQLERSLAIREQALPAGHPEIAQSLNNLGLLLARDGDMAGARPLLERALALREASLPEIHRDIALSLANLGWVLQELGASQEALAAHSRARSIREAVQGAEHWETAQSRLGIGDALAALGRLAEARDEVEHALRVFRQEWGDVHPRVGHGWLTLARIRARQGDTAGALEAALQAEQVGTSHLRAVAHLVSEREALEYALVRTQGRDLALSLLALPGVTKEQRARIWEAVARSRGLVMELVAERMRVAAHPDSERSALLVQEYLAATDALAKLLVRGEAKGVGGEQVLAAARERRERAERELAGFCPTVEDRRSRDGLTLAAVASALPEGTALVSFVHYRPDPAAHGGWVSSLRSVPHHYLALVLPAGAREVRAVGLGLASAVDALVAAWLEEVAVGASLPGRTPSQALVAFRQVGRRLRQAVWDPVARHLGDSRMVLLVPVANLHLVQWGTLPVGRAGYLVESEPLVHLLTAEHEAMAPQPGPLGAGLLALGAAAFDAELTVPASRDLPQRDAIRRGGWSACEGERWVRFDPIAASGPEVEELAALWRQVPVPGDRGDAVILTGAEATEEAFIRASRGRRIIHLATHGFFLDGECRVLTSAGRGIGGIAPAGSTAQQRHSGAPPLAGLALAGANRSSGAGPGRDDGILTSEEVSVLDLAGTEWVVLSACDTGRGALHLGEGVLGLQRAFRIAGARTVIMSLWGVGDESARAWMSALYNARLVEFQSTAEAVAAASRRVLAELRLRRESSHPSAWGPFVAAGDWR